MRNPVIVGLVWVASLVLVFLIGASFGPSSNEDRSAIARRGVDNVPVAETTTDAAKEPAAEVRSEASAPAAKETEPVKDSVERAAEDEAFTVEGVDSLQMLSDRFMKYADRKLSAGPEGRGSDDAVRSPH